MARIVLGWCPKKKKVVPINEIERDETKLARNYYTTDEMPPTRNPLNSREIFTSKSALRRRYTEAGAVEIGDAYERGYDPEKSHAEDRKRVIDKIMKQTLERHNAK
jgi:hypothetical protein